ncbi:hypothetical protein QOZ98_000550 [Planomicrobium stackebrandtii]|uniref:Uncharacterized protein n=1 Tax=Planomicrobium stackebrandtii TaxID=253160 RepID=A0ABU0GQV2_9BACL|nr:hypothetical protein [Planomicrobium stackebrandtii]MDQ0427725.1 hypothetical protein [Planomicrobium stackebrandtii]
MKKEEYIPLNKLGQRQKELPGVFPVFKKIRRVDGDLIGEVQAYSDEYGNRLEKDLGNKQNLH